MKRRAFITLIGGPTVAWRRTVRAQQQGRRRIGAVVPGGSEKSWTRRTASDPFRSSVSMRELQRSIFCTEDDPRPDMLPTFQRLGGGD
jgi:hypothetical protein